MRNNQYILIGAIVIWLILISVTFLTIGDYAFEIPAFWVLVILIFELYLSVCFSAKLINR